MKPTAEAYEHRARANFIMGVILIVISIFAHDPNGKIFLEHGSLYFISMSLMYSYFVYKEGGYDIKKIRPWFDFSDKMNK